MQDIVIRTSPLMKLFVPTCNNSFYFPYLCEEETRKDMDFDTSNIIIENDLNGLLEERLANYVGHFYCTESSCVIKFNEKELVFSQGDCMIITVPSMVSRIEPGEGFKTKAIYTSMPFLESCF